MTNLFINQLSDLSDQYSIQYDAKQASEGDDSIYYQGKYYQYAGNYEKNCVFNDRMLVIFKSLFYAFFPCAFGTAESFIENLQIIFTGKEFGKVYCDQDELTKVKVKTHVVAKKTLEPLPQDKDIKSTEVESSSLIISLDEEKESLELRPEEELAKWLEDAASKYPGQYPGDIKKQLLDFIKKNPNNRSSFFKYIDDLHNHKYPGLFIRGQAAYYLKKQYDKLFPLSVQKKIDKEKESPKLEPEEELAKWLEDAPTNQIKIQTFKVDGQALSSTDFHSFILQNEKILHPNKKQLLENTILHSAVKPSSASITYHIINLDEERFKKILNSKIQENKTKIESTSEWYDYDDPFSYWVDFANATTFGGGYKRRGNVQEETMFCEFPDLAYLDCAVNGNIHPCKEGHLFCPKDATPFIIKEVKRQWKVNPALYGRKLESDDFKGQISETGTLIEKIKGSTVNRGKAIERLHHQPPISIIGLAAIDWSKIPAKERQYQLSHLEYHLKAAYLGNAGAKQDSKERISIHTSNWGCGAFDNSNKMMVAIQILAAKMVDVDLLFHGTNGWANPNYTDKMVAKMEEFIQENLDQGKTPADLLLIFLDNQEDPDWAPKLPK